jgi:hypothetical protein
MQAVFVSLENAVKASVVEHLKEQLFVAIQDTIAKEVKEKVQREVRTKRTNGFMA